MHGHELTTRAALCACALLVLFALVVSVALANVDEPRLQGKHAVLECLAAVEPAWCLPHALLKVDLPRRRNSAFETRAASQARAADRAAEQLDSALASGNVRNAVGVSFPLVLKPNRYTNGGLGVSVVRSRSEAREALSALASVGVDALVSAGAQDLEVLVQAYAHNASERQDAGIEARLFGTAQRLGGAMAWHAVAYARSADAHRSTKAATVVDLPPAACERLSRAALEAWPRTPAIAMDVWSASVDALARGDLRVLEVNGSMGVPTRFLAQPPHSVSLRVAWLADAWDWVWSRARLGWSNVRAGYLTRARLAQEARFVSAFFAVARAALNHRS